MCKQMTWRIELIVLESNTWNNLTVGKEMSSGLLKMLATNYFANTPHIFDIYLETGFGIK